MTGILRTFVLLVPLVVAQDWETLYSPLYENAYLKLTTNEIVRIKGNNNYSDGDTVNDIVSPPVNNSNYSLGLLDGKLYAFYASEADEALLQISMLSDGPEETSWTQVHYNTTISNKTDYRYLEQSTYLTSKYNGRESFYIYGGRFNNSISNRLLQFDPTSNTLNYKVTSISPTAFFGSSSAILSSNGVSNLLIGGKATSGWVSMFQLALWEYESWTFKTVVSSSLNINSRLNPLVLPVFDDDRSDASSILVIGGTLNNKVATPHILKLNITSDWNWEEMSSESIDVDDLLGAVVFNSSLITVSGSKSKRSVEYMLDIYDASTLESVSEFEFSEYNDLSSLEESSSISSLSSTSISLSTTSSSAIASLSNATVSNTEHNSNHTLIIVAVVVPIGSVLLLAIIGILIWKKFFGKSNEKSPRNSIASNLTGSDVDSEFYKEFKTIADNESISSWNHKRDEYETQLYNSSSPTKQNDVQPPCTAEKMNSTAASFQRSLMKRMSIDCLRKSEAPNHQQGHIVHFDADELEDKQELNKSKTSLISSTRHHSLSEDMPLADDEESKIDEFLGSRDVQVLVSSKRRSKLRITNPDVESIQSTVPTASTSRTCQASSSDMCSGSTASIYDYLSENKILDPNDDVEHEVDLFSGNEEYVKQVLRRFDSGDDGSTDIGSL